MKKYTASSFVYLESLGQRKKKKQKKHQYQPGQKGVELKPSDIEMQSIFYFNAGERTRD